MIQVSAKSVFLSNRSNSNFLLKAQSQKVASVEGGVKGGYFPEVCI